MHAYLVGAAYNLLEIARLARPHRLEKGYIRVKTLDSEAEPRTSLQSN